MKEWCTIALGSFIAGRYSTTWNGNDLGITVQGWTLDFTNAMESIAPTDAFGDSLIDTVNRGGNVFWSGNSREWKTGVLAAANPWQTLAPTGASYLGPGTIGELGTNVAKSLVATATAGTPAAASPASITASYAMIAPGYNIQWLFDSRNRLTPLRLQLLLYSQSGYRWLTVA